MNRAMQGNSWGGIHYLFAICKFYVVPQFCSLMGIWYELCSVFLVHEELSRWAASQGARESLLFHAVTAV